MNLTRDFVQLIALFESFDVKYLVVGAHAVGVHGRPRATEDSDLFVEPSLENAEKTMAALCEFGFGSSLQPTLEEWSHPGIVFQMGVAPNRIDVMNSISGVSFEEAWREQVIVECEGVKIRVIGRAQLLANKQATGRTKDVGDADILARYDAKFRDKQK